MKKLNTSDFIKKSTLLHGNIYDYSLVNYVNSHTHVTIICKKHGPFLQLPYLHMQGYGCNECAIEEKRKLFSSDFKKFVENAIKIHGNFYNYSESVYINASTNIKIICPLHGPFLQLPYNHLNNHGCPECGKERTKKLTSIGTEKFIIRASKIHNNFYDYSKTIYINSRTKVIIICPIHGPFSQNPHDHLCGVGCPSCNSSKGELKIKEWLIEKKILFIPQYTTADCKNPMTNYKLRFDFYIPDKNLLIEYDGEQHFSIGKRGFYTTKESVEKTQFRDNIKTEYAIKQNIKPFRISYKDKNNILEILSKNIL